jgi:hypothetical protein
MVDKTKAKAVAIATPPPSLEGSALAEYASVEEWQKRFGGAVFQSRGAVEWFIKVNRIELIKRGALLTRQGRSGTLVHCRKFASTAETILKRQQSERLKH